MMQFALNSIWKIKVVIISLSTVTNSVFPMFMKRIGVNKRR